MTVLFDLLPAAITGAKAASGWGTALSTLSAGAGLLGALGGMQQQRQMAAAQEYNARVAEQNAAAQFAAGTSQAELIALRNRQQLGQARAAAGASGLDVASGSPLEIMADLAGLGAADVAVARRNAEARFTAGQDEARSRRMEAENTRRLAPINTAVSLLGTAAQFGANLRGYNLRTAR